MLVAVTDHAAERYRQRISGTLDAKLEIARRVGEALQAGRTSETAPPGASGARGSLYVSDVTDRALVYVCRQDGDEIVVITLWERPDGPGDPRVPRRFTDALRGAPQ